jgi:GTP-binding protein
MTFSIAVIGRPNVGKSTLFNKLVGKSLAIVDDMSGVTRDRKDAFGQLGPMEFLLTDTAGLEHSLLDSQLEKRMVDQTELAVLDANLCLFVVDGKVGITPEDIYFANWIRNSGKEAILVVNKMENRHGEYFGKEYYKLGLKQMVGVSAEHKEGFNDLYDAIEPYYDKYNQEFGHLMDLEDDGEKKLQIAVVGRPNAGKSTFLNSLIGKDRLITGPEAGITRDAISIDWEFEGQEIRLIDTAGIRKKSNVVKKLEQYSVTDSLRAVRFAQIVIILIDATNIIDHQDLAIARMVIKEGRGVVFGINKFDLIKDKDKTIDEVRFQLEKSCNEIIGAPILPISAINNHNVEKLMQFAIKVYNQWQGYVPTNKLNDWLRIAENKHEPILVKGKRTRLKYITQAKKRPPTFTLFTNYPKAIEGSYTRYLMKSLREYFDLKLTPIRLLVRKSDNPFKDKKEKIFSKKRDNGLRKSK